MANLSSGIWAWIAGFSQPPWPFVGFLVAIVCGLMAIPPLLQMKFGRPRLVLDFRTSEKNGDLRVSCAIVNQCISSRWLKFAGVRRDPAQGVSINFEVKDLRTKTKISSFFSHIYTGDSLPAQRVTITPSDLPSMAPIARVPHGNNQVILQDKNVLRVGAYLVTATIGASEDVFSVQRTLIVQDQVPYAYWGDR